MDTNEKNERQEFPAARFFIKSEVNFAHIFNERAHFVAHRFDSGRRHFKKMA